METQFYDLKTHERCVKCGLCRNANLKVKGPCRECSGIEFVGTGGPRANRSPERKARKERIRWCHMLIVAMVKLGLLKALDGSVRCVDCDGSAAVYEHRDYWKPLEVEAVCYKCNTRRGPGQSLPPERR